MPSHHCTQEGADSYVGLSMLPKDRGRFEAHLAECSDGRCMKRLLEAEERLNSRPLADLVSAFLQTHARRVNRGTCYPAEVVEDAVKGVFHEVNRGYIQEVLKHLRTCSFCRAFASPFAGRSLRHAKKEQEEVPVEGDAVDDDGPMAISAWSDDPLEGSEGTNDAGEEQAAIGMSWTSFTEEPVEPVLRAPLEIERGEDEVETPAGFVRTDGEPAQASAESAAQQDGDSPGGRSGDYPDIDIIEGA